MSKTLDQLAKEAQERSKHGYVPINPSGMGSDAQKVVYTNDPRTKPAK